ncbi:MAG: glycosyltransferase family 87 protein [Candidatus Limnocylindrales bacterium]
MTEDPAPAWREGAAAPGNEDPGPRAELAALRTQRPGAGAFGTDPARRRMARLGCLLVATFGWANLAILGQAMLAKNPPQAGFDLQLLLDAARRVAAGGSPYDPNAVTNGLQARDLFYSYPPAVAQFLVPLSGLPSWLVLTGSCIGAVIGLAVVAFALARSPIGRPALARREFSLDVTLLALAVGPFFFPFAVALLFGNVDAWFPFLFGAVALTLASGRAVPSQATSMAGGAALAIASVVKLHPGTLAVWLAARWSAASGSRRAFAAVVGAAIVSGVAILAASLLVGGLGPWRDYLGYLRMSGNADLTSAVNVGPASQLALLAGNPNLARPLAVVFALVAISVTVGAARFVRDQLESFGWAIVASLVVLPVTWYHYSVALIPVALAAWTRSRGTPRAHTVTLTLAAAFVVADAAIALPVALWLAVAALFVAVRWSRPQPLPEPAPAVAWASAEGASEVASASVAGTRPSPAADVEAGG